LVSAFQRFASCLHAFSTARFPEGRIGEGLRELVRRSCEPEKIDEQIDFLLRIAL
jgi:hypothetical protein